MMPVAIASSAIASSATTYHFYMQWFLGGGILKREYADGLEGLEVVVAARLRSVAKARLIRLELFCGGLAASAF